ncbi:STAS domain-containing protein [Kineococcus sp. LSe6-4]|uniref:STAS domain-containing protein n=1 Tax=Kineococcus halophytocola TaxID=3234027 RepID=A0ABV4H1R0_9ACTN
MDRTSPVRLEGSPVLVLDPHDLRGGLGVLRWRLGRLLDGPMTVLVVDVSGLTTLSSATVAALLRARRLCRARGGHLVLRNPRRSVTAVLRRSGLEDLFETTFDEVPEHRAAPQPQAS